MCADQAGQGGLNLIKGNHGALYLKEPFASARVLLGM